MSLTDRDANGSTDRLWVVVPAFNESRVIAATLAGLRPYLPNVVVVDDGSCDDTAAVARASGATLLRHVLNLGQGAALRTGIDYALSRGARWICTFDADGQHDPATIERMRDAAIATSAGVVLGTRFGSERSNVSPLRRLVLGLALRFTRMQTKLPLTDTHNGLRLFAREAAARLRLEQSGMAHASEILTIVAREGLRVIEVPTKVTYTVYSLAKGQRLSNAARIAFDLAYARLTQ